MRLILMRHAKSSWSDTDLPDHRRPLANRGRNAARAIGDWLTDHDHGPQVTICSPATRAMQTFELVAERMPNRPQLTLKDAIYQGDPTMAVSALIDRRPDCGMIIGHNPSIGLLASALLDQPPDHPAFAQFPTAATLVCEECARADSGFRCLHFIVPRDLAPPRRG